MEESRVKNTSKNLIYSLIFQIVKIFLVFVSRIIFVRKLGASYLGVNGLFSNILGILSLTDLGMTTVLMYSLYKPLTEKDENLISKYMNFFRKMYNIIAIVVVCFGLVLIPFLKYLVNLPENMDNIYLYYILLLCNSAFSYLFVYKTTLISADQKMFLLNKYDTIFQFILFFLQLFVLIFTNSFTLYLVANLTCTLLANIVKVRKTEELYPFLKKNNNLQLKHSEKKKIFNDLKSLFLYKIGGVIQNNTDNIFISVFAGTIVVGYYSNYLTVITSVTTFLNMAFTSLKASMGNFIVKKDKKSQLDMFNILETFNFWLVGFSCICFFTLLPDFIKICFGEEYILGLPLLICVVFNFYTSNIRQTIWTYRETTGIFNKTKYITLVTSVFNLILSFIFGYFFGITGVIAASVIARLLYAWWKEPTILFKDYFKTSPKCYFFNYIKKIFTMSCISMILYFICSAITINNIYIAFFTKACVSVVITLMIFFIIYRKSEGYQYLKTNIIKNLRRN